jgi:hypothetical protein
MPGLRRDHQVESTARRVPILELGLFDTEAMGSRESRHATVGLDTQHPTPAGSEQSRGDSCATAHIEHLASSLGEKVDQVVRIGRTRPVIAQSVGPERQSPRSILVQHPHIIAAPVSAASIM